MHLAANRLCSTVPGRRVLTDPTIEETRDLIRAAGGQDAERVVDHENPDQLAAHVAEIDDEHGSAIPLMLRIATAHGTRGLVVE